MSLRFDNILHKTILILTLFVFSWGADVLTAGASEALSGVGVLQEIIVTGETDGTLVEINASKPLTYTFYKNVAPLTAVVDLAQIDPGKVPGLIDVSSDIIRRINVSRHGEGLAAMTRIEILLNKDVEIVPAASATKLLIHLKNGMVPVTAATAPAVTAPATVEATAAVPAAQVTPGTVPVTVADTKDSAPTAPIVPAPVEAKQPPVATPAGLAITSITSGKDSIEITTNGPVEKYKYFRLYKPERLVLDVFGAKSALAGKTVTLNSSGVTVARLGTYPDKTRIVFDSAKDDLPPFVVEKSDAGIKISITPPADEPVKKTTPPIAPAKVEAIPAKGAIELQTATPVSPPGLAAAKKPAAPATPSIESIEFKQVDGLARITLTIEGECAVVGPAKTKEGLSLTLKNCLLPKKWQRSLDTSAFDSVVQKVTPFQVTERGVKAVKIQVKLRQQSPSTVKQEGSTLFFDITDRPKSAKLKPAAVMAENEISESEDEGKVVSTRPREAVAEKAAPIVPSPLGKGKIYTGRRVTLEFSDADIRKIFQLIAEVSNLNFLIGDDVSGTISIKLVNVPWDQALDVILETKGLGMQRDGNIVQIKPKSKIQSLADEELTMKKAKERGMELRTEIFDVNFSNLSDIAGQFAGVKSERGTITPDSRTKRIIVKDIAPALEDMKFLIRNLDLPEKQVMIEARIVEATSTFTRDLGVKWGLHYLDGSASMAGINQLDSGFGGVVSLPPTSGVGDAATTGGAVGMSFGKLTSNVQLDLRLSAAATAGQVKVISAPKVVTLNHRPASITQGVQIPYQTTSAEGTKTEFKTAALSLEVTPDITPDGSVFMKITASNDSPGAGTPPPINTKKATTELLVKNGETTVIGGIFVDNDTTGDTGVPFLMDIPLLGWLFKSNTKSKTKSELLIFITPRMVN